MAKRTVIGIICKGKEGKGDYLKIKQTVTLNEGEIVNLESKNSRLESLKKAVESGKLSDEKASELRQIVEKTPDWIRFELTVYR